MIVGEKVRLRLLEREDLELIARWRNEPRVASQFFGCWPFALSEQSRWYEDYLNDPRQRMWIVETIRGEAIGCMALINIDHHNQRAELGRVLIGDQSHIGADCAKEAVRLLVTFAFTEANLHRIVVQVLARNEVALGLYETCGFEDEGLLREAVWKAGRFEDIQIMAILRETCCD